jgi:hypothetical protein
VTWPSPIGSGPSAYAWSVYSGKTNSCLGTVKKALSTRWSVTPEERIDSSTRACLAFIKGSPTLISAVFFLPYFFSYLCGLPSNIVSRGKHEEKTCNKANHEDKEQFYGTAKTDGATGNRWCYFYSHSGQTEAPQVQMTLRATDQSMLDNLVPCSGEFRSKVVTVLCQ